MGGSSLITLGILLLGVMPTLGFFSPGSAFVLLFVILFLFLIFIKGTKITLPQETVSIISIIILIYAAFYYGGFYQPPYFKALGQILFFSLISFLTWSVYAKHPIRPAPLVICYVLLGFLTLATSPHPHVDTVVVFREAPLKLLHGMNPYDALYSQVYNNIKPDYYNHLPLSFIFYIPFVLLPFDERIAIMLVTVGSFYLFYKRVPQIQKQHAILPLSLILFMPGSFYMLEHMYHDSMIFFFFSMAIFFLAVSDRLYYLFLSFFFSVKQNLFLGLPFFVNRTIFKNKNWLFFTAPFLLILVFFLWNPAAFLNDTVFGLRPDKITSPIDISLTFPTLIAYLLPSTVPAPLIRNISLALLVVMYLVFLRFHKGSPSAKMASVLFVSYFFSYYAFFNSYYLVLMLFLYDFIRESYLPKAIRHKAP